MTRFTRLLALVMAVCITGTASATTTRGGPLAEAARFRTEPSASMVPFAPDSADSLYREARRALDDGSYQRAAELFGSIVDQYPASRYAADALYWRAFALYRRGGSDDLRDALRALDTQRRTHPGAATHGDAAALATRIRGELARRGDRTAAESVTVAARGAEHACPSEDDDMRVAALNALLQMDADQAIPILKKVLARRDPCSEELRRKAVFLVSQKQSDESADILLGVARDDPSDDVRGQAVFWLGQTHGDRAVALLDSILHSTTDEDVQNKAIFALSQHDDPRAIQALHDLIERPGASEDVKARAIFALGHFTGRRTDVEYLEALYPKLTSERLKEQVIQSVAQSGGDGERWVMAHATDAHEDLDLRKKALFWGGQNAQVSDLAALYDRMTGQEMKEQLVFVLSQHSDRAATDKLIDIARHDPDRDLRRKAIFWLGERDDPRVRQLLEELINDDSR